MTKHIIMMMAFLLCVVAFAQNDILTDGAGEAGEEDGGGGVIANAVHELWKAMPSFGRMGRRLLGTFEDKADCTAFDKRVGNMNKDKLTVTGASAPSQLTNMMVSEVSALFDVTDDFPPHRASDPRSVAKLIGAKSATTNGVLLNDGDGVSAYIRPKAVKRSNSDPSSAGKPLQFALVRYEGMDYQKCPGADSTTTLDSVQIDGEIQYFNDPVIGLRAWDADVTATVSTEAKPDTKFITIEFPLNPTLRAWSGYDDAWNTQNLRCAWFDDTTTKWVKESGTEAKDKCVGFWDKTIERMVCECKGILGFFAVVVEKDAVWAKIGGRTSVTAAPTNATTASPTKAPEPEEDYRIGYIIVSVAFVVVSCAIWGSAYYFTMQGEDSDDYSSSGSSYDDRSSSSRSSTGSERIDRRSRRVR